MLLQETGKLTFWPCTSELQSEVKYMYFVMCPGSGSPPEAEDSRLGRKLMNTLVLGSQNPLAGLAYETNKFVTWCPVHVKIRSARPKTKLHLAKVLTVSNFRCRCCRRTFPPLCNSPPLSTTTPTGPTTQTATSTCCRREPRTPPPARCLAPVSSPPPCTWCMTRRRR